MPKITAISQQKRKGRFNIYLDEKFAFGVDEDTLIREGLIVGKEISELEISELEEKSEVGKLYQKALRFLGYRPRSEREVRDYLNSKLRSQRTQKTPISVPSVNLVPSVIQEGTEERQIIDRILKRLKSLNYLDDLGFVRWWVEQRRSSSKPRGIKLIKAELYQKGVGREIVERVLQTNEKPATAEAQKEAENTEINLALKAAQSYLKRPKSPKRLKQLKQLTAYLARRGFEWETIKTVVDKLLPRE